MKHWRVEVSIEGDSKLVIESGSLAGVDNIEEYSEEIRTAALHLLGFIGNDKSDCFACDGDDIRCPICGISDHIGNMRSTPDIDDAKKFIDKMSDDEFVGFINDCAVVK
jgi:hypothetical protein